jgi:hypothetical protein
LRDVSFPILLIEFEKHHSFFCQGSFRKETCYRNELKEKNGKSLSGVKINVNKLFQFSTLTKTEYTFTEKL